MLADASNRATRQHWPSMWTAATIAICTIVGCSGSARSAVYYVDYSEGADSATGDRPDAPWKHAPGDRDATGKAAAVALQPGDRVRFRGGVAYRGTLTLPASGAPGRPIVFAGDEWGPQPAVFEGADLVQKIEPCASALACGGAGNWQELSLVSYRPPPTSLIKFFDASGALFESQYPEPKDPFFADDVTEYLATPPDQAARIEQGELRSSSLAEALGGWPEGATLSIWTYGNQVARRPITAISGDTISFLANNLRLYKDRPGRVAVLNAIALVNTPGEYAVVAPGLAVVQLRQKNGALHIGNGRRAIDLGGQSNVVIRGFKFQHYTAAKYGEGVQITNSGKLSTDVDIQGNVFQNSSMYSGAGPIMIGRVNNATIRGNTFKNIERGSGIRTNLKPVSNLTIYGNHFDRVGKTGILVMGSSNVNIENNTLNNLYGIHGNGISVYMDNRSVKVTGNRISNASRPMTFHGEEPGTSPGDHNLIISNNVFITNLLGSSALISYGKIRNARIDNNVLIAPKDGLLLSAKDSGVVVTNNATTGIAIKGNKPSDWVMKDNSSVTKAQRKDAAALIPKPAS